MVVKEGKVAVSKRLDLTHCLQFPGGKVESGEECQAAAQRELAEETELYLERSRFAPLVGCLPAVGFSGENYMACSFVVALAFSEMLCNPERHLHTNWVFVDPASLVSERAMLTSSKRALQQAMEMHAHLFSSR